MKLLSMQIALFPLERIQRPDLLMNVVNEKNGNILDAMPNIINLPVDAPVDIPIVQARSTNNVYALNISRNRVDFIITPQFERDEVPTEVLKSYKSVIEKYYKAVLGVMGIVRVGVILTVFENIQNNVKAVYDKYLKIPFENGCIEVSTRTNKQSLCKGYVLNNIKNVEAGELHVGATVHKGVIIQMDTNNVPDTTNLLNADSIASVLVQATNKIKAGALKELI